MSVSTNDRHPLQKLPSPSLGASAMVHLSGLSSFIASFKFIIDNPNFANEAYGWHFQYLTIIGLTLATMTFTAGLCADLFSSRRMFLVKNMLSVCSTPLEVLITVLYWGLKMIDERLVVPEWAQKALVLDLGFHAVPALALVVDLLLFSPPWAITAMPSFGLATSIAFAYWFWVEQCYKYNGWYPYPLFEKLTTPWRIALFLVSAALMTLNTALLQWVYSKLNGHQLPLVPKTLSDSEKEEENI